MLNARCSSKIGKYPRDHRKIAKPCGARWTASPRPRSSAECSGLPSRLPARSMPTFSRLAMNPNTTITAQAYSAAGPHPDPAPGTAAPPGASISAISSRNSQVSMRLLPQQPAARRDAPGPETGSTGRRSGPPPGPAPYWPAAAVPEPARTPGCCARIRKSSSPGPRRSPRCKNSSGSSGVYHSGYSFSGTIRNKVPSELWCSVESSTPRIISGNRDPVDPAQWAVPAELLEHHREELQEQHGGVERHAPRHFEHHRVRIPHHQRVPQAVRPAEVEQQSRPLPANTRGTRSGSPGAALACSARC